jgi:branched-chain amino acid transport system substrate-binding protein
MLSSLKASRRGRRLCGGGAEDPPIGAEAVIFGGYHPEAASLVSQMRKKNIRAYFLSDDGVKDNTFIKVAGRYAEGVYASGPKDTSKNPLAKAAEAAYRRAYNSEPGPSS